MMTKQEALQEADRIIEGLVRRGDPLIFDAARDASGKLDLSRIATAALAARDEIAGKIMRGEM